LFVACTSEPPLEPNPPDADLPAAGPSAALPARLTLPACTHRWAAAVSGSWFDAARWSPASVPGAASTACIDAEGTYTVTMDPVNDATPVDLAGLAVGGATSGVQTLLMGGVGAAIVNLTAGAEVKAGGVVSVSGAGGTRVTAPEVSNAGTLQSTALCGG
jgi:hypothetical protein